jgi:hypothetical protein
MLHLRQAARVLLKNPRFSLVAIAALALGIGANAAIFSVVNAVLLRPLPYQDPDRLVTACRQYPNGRGCAISIPKYFAWRPASAFQSVAAYDFAGPGMNIGGGDRPEQVQGIHVSADYFNVFGASPQLGAADWALGRHQRRSARRYRRADRSFPTIAGRRPVPATQGGSEQHESRALSVGRRALEAGSDGRAGAGGNQSPG